MLDLEIEILKKLNSHTDLLNQLYALLLDIQKGKTIEQEWYDSADTMRILKISKRSVYRLRQNHPKECKRISGKWYYNLKAMLLIK